MTLQRQAIFWVVALLVTAFLLTIFRTILLPFVAGFALAYMLDPLADRLQRIGFGRLGASLIILILFVLIFIVALVVIVPLVGKQLGEFVDRVPSYVARLQQLAVEQGGPLVERLGGSRALQDIQTSVGNLISQGLAWMGTFLQGLWSGGQALLGIFSLLVVTPVVAFYMLIDWDRMVSTVDSWMPMKHRDTIRAIARDIDKAIAGFVRGQALVCVILGTFYAVALTLLGLNFGAMIGMTSGVLSFIPYVGSLTGLILSMGVAIVQFWPDWTLIAATLGIFVFGQFVEGNILSPKLVGESVGLHPVWLMFALLAFGSLFGFVGLLLAVPLAAALGVIARFALHQYLLSPLYRGTDPAVITPKVDLDA